MRLLCSCAMLLLFLAPAHAGRVAMTDQELDDVTARGINLEFITDAAGNSGIQFEFDVQDTVAVGDLVTSPLEAPSSLVLDGVAATKLFDHTFVAQNMILNINICIYCQTAFQTGFGAIIPVSTFSNAP